MTAQAIERAQTVTRGKRLEYFTILWNTLEGIIAIVILVNLSSQPAYRFGEFAERFANGTPANH